MAGRHRPGRRVAAKAAAPAIKATGRDLQPAAVSLPANAQPVCNRRAAAVAKEAAAVAKVAAAPTKKPAAAVAKKAGAAGKKSAHPPQKAGAASKKAATGLGVTSRKIAKRAAKQ